MKLYQAKGFAAAWIIAAMLIATVSNAGAPATKALPAVPVYQPKHFPFDEGEQAVYHARWNGIPVGTAEVRAVPVVSDGKKFYRVRVEAQTSKALDLVWKMRDTISSTFDARLLAPSRFVFNQRENSRVVDTEATYNPATKEWFVDRREPGKKPRVQRFEAGNTFDPITAVYLARSVDFKVGDKLLFNVFGGRSRYLLELAVQSKEPVTLESGKTIDAYKIVPKVTNLSKKGYASRMNNASIWISADERRMPVKLTSKIFVGTVQMELVEDRAGTRSVLADRPPKPAG
ncbi:MAG TPA: DUF3108 domain-containing protein [Candidatus Eisenbacteria bacterium]|nr:DUF3108 domain-containing protein [Candidatus Eisenbacteria bacterium]